MLRHSIPAESARAESLRDASAAGDPEGRLVDCAAMAEAPKPLLVPDPIFVVGAERSGTTLLNLMLDGHPELAWLGEFEFALKAIPERGWPDLAAFRDWLSIERMFLALELDVDPALSFEELLNSFLLQVRKRAGKRRVGATTHKDFDKLPRLWPQARYVHLLRDGRDVARSRIGMGWAGNLWCASWGWLEAEQTWDVLKAQLAPQAWIEVRYEDLVGDPRGELERICDHIGLSFDEGLLAYPGTTTYSLPDAAMAYQWKRKLSPHELGLSEAVIGPMLATRGYPASGAPGLEVTPAQRRRLRVQDRLARTRYRVKSFGLPLVAADFLTRRLALSSLNRPVRRRMDAITTRHLK